MSQSQQQELVEIYKLHAELADRVSQRREGANRLFVSILVAVFALTGFLLRFGGAEIGDLYVPIICLLGFLLSGAWFMVIRSYQQLNTGKFKALHELEEELAYSFFKREWKLLSEGKEFRKYWRLTVAERLLSLIFGLAFFALFIAVLVDPI